MKRRVKTNRHTKPSAISYILVVLQVVLMVLIFMLPGIRGGGPLTLLANMLIIFGGCIIIVAIWQLRKYSLTALPTPITNAKLLKTGLYAKVRHPIYSGIMLWAIGYSIIRPTLARFITLVALGSLFWLKSSYEERLLSNYFGSAYTSYVAKVGRFIPRRT